MRKILISFAAIAATQNPASAAVVFNDNFDSENVGQTGLNYAGFSNFSVTGNVDVVQNGTFFLTCAGGTGSCVDLDGSNGPGRITSNRLFAVNAGDRVRLTLDMSGHQRTDDPVPSVTDNWMAGFRFTTPVNVTGYGSNIFGTNDLAGFDFFGTNFATGATFAGAEPFATRSIFFKVNDPGLFDFYFSTDSTDGYGPILDNVQLSIAAVPEPATWGMMILGFGFAGGAMRARKRSVRFATATA